LLDGLTQVVEQRGSSGSYAGRQPSHENHGKAGQRLFESQTQMELDSQPHQLAEWKKHPQREAVSLEVSSDFNLDGSTSSIRTSTRSKSGCLKSNRGCFSFKLNMGTTGPK
jgi:hypothetical protein